MIPPHRRTQSIISFLFPIVHRISIRLDPFHCPGRQTNLLRLHLPRLKNCLTTHIRTFVRWWWTFRLFDKALGIGKTIDTIEWPLQLWGWLFVKLVDLFGNVDEVTFLLDLVGFSLNFIQLLLLFALLVVGVWLFFESIEQRVLMSHWRSNRLIWWFLVCFLGLFFYNDFTVGSFQIALKLYGWLLFNYSSLLGVSRLILTVSGLSPVKQIKFGFKVFLFVLLFALLVVKTNFQNIYEPLFLLSSIIPHQDLITARLAPFLWRLVLNRYLVWYRALVDDVLAYWPYLHSFFFLLD